MVQKTKLAYIVFSSFPYVYGRRDDFWFRFTNNQRRSIGRSLARMSVTLSRFPGLNECIDRFSTQTSGTPRAHCWGLSPLRIHSELSALCLLYLWSMIALVGAGVSFLARRS